MTALTDAIVVAYLDELVERALQQMADGQPADVIVACLKANLAWIEAQR